MLLFVICIASKTNADTLTVMHYNLMYFDKDYDDCNSTTNNVTNKEEYLKTIVGYVKPDILTVNEVNSSISSVERIKNNALNVNGTSHYKRANFSGSFLSNMVYYNSNKLELKSQTSISTSPRITDVYRLYLKTSSLVNGDTIFITCFVTHLKAGNTEADANERKISANQIMNYILASNLTGNLILMGDMNLYTSTEGAFVSFMTPVGGNQFRFFDPVNMVGEWNNNYNFRMVHTQSTHSSSTPCFSSGGMDDRFDFILTSSDIISGNKGLMFYSYKTVAQDGNRFNQSLISPTNSSVPAEVLNSLYNMSDHLPVQMKLVYNTNSTSISTKADADKLAYNNPAPVSLNIKVLESSLSITRVTFYNIIGQKLYSSTFANNQSVEIETANFDKGLLVVEVLLSNGYKKTFKVIK